MSKFKETPKRYDALEVDSEIAMLTSSRDFWKKRYEELTHLKQQRK